MRAQVLLFSILLIAKVHCLPEKGDLQDLIASVYRGGSSNASPSVSIPEEKFTQQVPHENTPSVNGSPFQPSNNPQTNSQWNGNVDELIGNVFGNQAPLGNKPLPASKENENVNNLIANVFGNKPKPVPNLNEKLTNEPENSESLESSVDEDLIASIFGTSTESPSTPPPPLNPDGSIPGLPQATGCSLGFECVPHYLCKNNKIIKDGQGLLDIRFDGETPMECASYLDVCCSVDDQTDKPIIQPPVKKEGCGYRNQDGLGFKINGSNNETEYGEFPWMVAIFREGYRFRGYVEHCTGTLIHPSIVLTAAHCVYGRRPRSLGARAGEWDLKTTNEPYPNQDRTVVDYIIHENFRRNSLYNDVALLILEKPFELTDNVKTACLPPANSKFDGARCIAAGWELDFFDYAKRFQNIIKKTELPIVPRKTCKNIFRRKVFRRDFHLHRSFLCAGGEGLQKTNCALSGGSALMCPITGSDERYYQTGMILRSNHHPQDTPELYVNIARFRRWIDEQLAYRNVDSAHYTP